MLANKHPDVKTTTELNVTDNLLWSSLIADVCKLARIPLALGKKMSDFQCRRVTVPITFRLEHIHHFDLPNPLRPPFYGIDLEQLGEHERELAQDLGKLPLRAWILVPEDFCTSMGMPKVALLLATIQISDLDVPQASKDVCHLVDGIGGAHPEWACSAIMRYDKDLRARLEASYPYRLLCEGVRLWLEAKEAGQVFDIEAWLRQHAYTQWTPAVLPHFTSTGLHGHRYYAITVVQGILVYFRDFESFAAARDDLMVVIRNLQAEHGRQWVVDNVVRIQDDWFKALFRRELNDPAWADHYNRKKFRDTFAAIEGLDGHALDLVHCQSFRDGHLHSVLAVFGLAP